LKTSKNIKFYNAGNGKIDVYLTPELLRPTFRSLGITIIGANTIHTEINSKMSIVPPFLKIEINEMDMFKKNCRIYNTMNRLSFAIQRRIQNKIVISEKDIVEKKYTGTLKQKVVKDKSNEFFNKVVGATILIDLEIDPKELQRPKRVKPISKLDSKESKHKKIIKMIIWIEDFYGYEFDPFGEIKRRLKKLGYIVNADLISTLSIDGTTICNSIWEVSLHTNEKDLSRIFDYIDNIKDNYFIVVKDDEVKLRLQKKLDKRISFLKEEDRDKVSIITIHDVETLYKKCLILDGIADYNERLNVEKKLKNWFKIRYSMGK